MKYIDADRMRAEIERMIHEISHPLKDGYEVQSIGKIEGLSELLENIDSLQQEQPEVDLKKEIEKKYEQAKWGYVDGFGAVVMDKGQFIRIARHFAQWGAEHIKIDVTDFCKPIDPGVARCIADHSWEMLGEDENPAPTDLEEAAKRIAYDVCRKLPNGEEKDSIVYYAILAAMAGSEWQKELNEKVLSEKIAAAYQLGLADKEKQMMSKAVEGFIFQSTDYYPKQLIAGYDGELGMGDKVRVIVLPKED